VLSIIPGRKDPFLELGNCAVAWTFRPCTPCLFQHSRKRPTLNRPRTIYLFISAPIWKTSNIIVHLGHSWQRCAPHRHLFEWSSTKWAPYQATVRPCPRLPFIVNQRLSMTKKYASARMESEVLHFQNSQTRSLSSKHDHFSP